MRQQTHEGTKKLLNSLKSLTICSLDYFI